MGNTHYDATNVKIRNSRVTLTFDARRRLAGAIQLTRGISCTLGLYPFNHNLRVCFL
jgi:hypothetical protein